ncbi:hypothetical protein JTE90_002363 [Oedothorax gibbosus]|uniref:Uncharacterized protein n=1 Tax=Oedothorax gibbosus TaxID=931172 RepID=A0AAV6VEU7_9ARAC|nr:hypothetical protein JTE90_002363 [Oedothorax gibbosus]
MELNTSMETDSVFKACRFNQQYTRRAGTQHYEIGQRFQYTRRCGSRRRNYVVGSLICISRIFRFTSTSVSTRCASRWRN